LLTFIEKENDKTSEGIPSFGAGVAILFFAQVLSAIMGIYTEETYKEYGPHWKENLFYSHLLALPLFLPFLPSMKRQFLKLAASPPLVLPAYDSLSNLPADFRNGMDSIHIPSQLAYLVMNVLTQYACIRGVNLLASAATALTVTIVLNMRKLLSLMLSIWLFGNRLSLATSIGAVIVFASGGMYALEGSQNTSRTRHRASVSNGKVG
jgi:UDP-xylose/UDP-N-acetylglucosamine transporter B4